MAQLDTGGNSNSKQKKMNARVDFTPMVDMIMLLVTFFMLCTTLLKPQTMEITMPSDKDDIKKEQKSQVQTDEAITIIIGKDNKLYYFAELFFELLFVLLCLFDVTCKLCLQFTS